MEILKGMVREKGFEDKECTYMKTDDGKQFYFIENFQLSNGNIIACSDLSQGVGNKPRETLGVITPRGDIIIPFENKMIKPLENNLLLVERNTPITPNVADALAKKDDSQVATNYMNDANTIKSQLKSVMAGGEDYIFDNPFSEAALYTLEGVNVGGNYFSFIGKTGNDYYLSTNIVGSSILKYDSSVNMNSGNTSDEMAPSNQENTVDQDASIPSVTNDNAVPPSGEQQDVNASVANQVGNENSENSLSQEPLVPNIEIPIQLQQQVEDNISKGETVNPPSVDSSTNIQDTVSIPSNSSNQPQGQVVNQPEVTTDTTSEELPKTELNIELPLSDTLGENNQDTATNGESDNVLTTDDNINQNDGMVNIDGDNLPNDSIVEDDTNSESDNTDLTNEDIQIPSTDQVEESTSSEGDTPKEEQSSVALNIPDGNTEEDEDIEESNTEPEGDSTSIEDGNITPENEDGTEEDSNADTSDDGGVNIGTQLPEDFDENSLEKEETEEEDYEEYQEEEITNPVIIDATNTIRKLLEENRKQREIIDRQESEIETLASSNSILKENNDSKSKEIISLRNSMAKYRNQNATLSRENNNLKATNTRQEELIENLKSQNITLKEQVAGITALGNAVKEATTVIETHQENLSQPSELSYLDTTMGDVAYQKKKTA